MKTQRFVFSILLYILFITTAIALPRFAARMNLKCQDCHIDPNGGGMRNYYGAVMYARETLPVRAWSNDSTMGSFTSRLSDFVSIGTDIRTILFHQSQNNYTSFNQMQGDIYLSIRLVKNLLVYFNKSLYQGFDVFGIMNGLPMNGYWKVGRFTPAYGTLIDDHTAFIRSKTVFPNYRREDTGMEVGISPQSITWNVGIYNGENGSDPSNGKIRLLTTRADVRCQIEDFKLSLGGSAWDNNAITGECTIYGGFGSLSYHAFTLNTEIDFKKDKAALGTNEFISYLEFNYLILDGVDVKFMYDFYDPDTKYLTGSESKYSFGLEFFPIQSVELRPVYRIITNTRGYRIITNTPGSDNENEFDFLVHFYL